MKLDTTLAHFTIIIIATIILGVIYATVQQSHRSTANDPQLQMARDITLQLKQNKPVDKLLPSNTVDLEKSLGVFVQFYNAQQQPIFSTGLINGEAPKIPAGVLNEAKNNYENSVTWQPQPNVRLATVTEYVGAKNIDYILVGRSLQEVEVRESSLVKMVFIGWVICVGVIVLHWAILTYSRRSAKAN